MKNLWRKLSTITFWLSWPLTWLAFNKTERSRLMIFKNGRLLVTRSWLGDGRWGLPGGGIHKSESPLESVIREVDEELGLDLSAKSIKRLVGVDVRERGFANVFHYFMAEVGEVRITPRPFEVSEFGWMAPAELNNNNAGADVLHGLANLSKHRPDLLK